MTQFCAPQNTSLLNPNEFRFFLHKAPYLSFFVQTVALPTINMGSEEVPTPFSTINVPGDHIDWEELSVTMLVDEDLQGWREMYNWMRGMAFPSSFDEYVALREKETNSGRKPSVWEAITSDISVFTNTGSRNVNLEYLFYDAYPVMLSAPTLSTINPDQPVVTSKVRFRYTIYDIIPRKTS